MNNYMKVIINALKQWTTNKLSIVDQALENKIDKVEGKGLSTEDFTTEYKEKLDSLTPDFGDVEAIAKDAVLYTEQTLTNEQKAQARKNISVKEDVADALLHLEFVKPIGDEDAPLTENNETFLVVRNEDIFLPEVTTENDGNVLKVVDGKWAMGEIEIVEVPSIEGLATETYVDNAIANINIYYTKNEIDNMEFITTDEIDEICSRSIQFVSPTNGTF